MKKFEFLLQRFIDNKATPQEVDEFLKLVQDEAHDEAVEKALTNDDGPYELTKAEKFKVVTSILPKDESRSMLPRMVWMAAAVVLPLIIGVWAYRQYVLHPAEAVQLAQEKIYTIQGPDHVRLPDQSIVELREGSKLTYNGSFGADSREVELSGEAFFDIVHNPSSPFKVRTGKVVTTVLGTAFNVNAAPDKEITVTVTRGKVAVGDDNRVYETITSNEQIAVNAASLDFVKKNVNAEAVAQWKNDFFIMDGVTMEQAAVKVGERFNVNVIIDNSALKGCVISAWFVNHEGLEQVVESISAVWQAEYTINDGKVTIEGGTGCD